MEMSRGKKKNRVEYALPPFKKTRIFQMDGGSSRNGKETHWRRRKIYPKKRETRKNRNESIPRWAA